MPAFVYFVVLAVSIARAGGLKFSFNPLAGAEEIFNPVPRAEEVHEINAGGVIKNVGKKIKGGAESVLENFAKKIKGGGDHEEDKDDEDGKFADRMVCECMDNPIS